MSQQEVVSGHEYVGVADLIKLSELERVLEPYKTTDEYKAIFRYYQGCIDAENDQALLHPLALLDEALGSLTSPVRARRDTEEPLSADNSAETVLDLYQKVSDYGIRVAQSVETLNGALPQVPKKLHFVWLGGGIGEIQRDYINVWKQVLAAEGYELKLWYDSDALLAYETNRIVVEAAKADAMKEGGDAAGISGFELADLYEERVAASKEQVFNHVTNAPVSADEARIDLLVRGYAQNESALRALRERNLNTLQALTDAQLQLVDIRPAAGSFPLFDIYEREIGLRANLAAASDVVRYQVLYNEGGIYCDSDYLPAFVDELGETPSKDIIGPKANLGVLQLIFERNPHLMPGRVKVAEKYARYIEEIPAQYLSKLEQFANSHPSIPDIFTATRDLNVASNALRAAFVDNTSLNNSFLMAHPKSKVIESVMDRVRFMYELRDEFVVLSTTQGVSITDQKRVQNAEELFASREHSLALAEPQFINRADALTSYMADGLIPKAQTTIFMTGPDAMRVGMDLYEAANLTPDAAIQFRKEAELRQGFNYFTEEEQDHSWKESITDWEQWRDSEQGKWKQGLFKAHYKGDMAELLKRQSIEFDAGWPLIEGRHVLLTDILQRLLDHFGEPFFKAMSQGIDGIVTFDKLLPLSFDDRQAIIAQDPLALPPVTLSDATTRDLSLIEVLERLASGSWLKEHLSAAQRLLLGPVLGLESLDNRSFAAMTGELDDLAARLSNQGVASQYAVIEEQLLKHKGSEFVAGLKNSEHGDLALTETALLLKKNALQSPLSLRQWGRRVARIEKVAKAEFRDRLTERAADLMETFKEGEARFVPQNLLYDGFGDTIGRRCYPLVLAMAAAIAKGDAAVTTLRERFFLSVETREQSHSQTFMRAIEALHSVDVSEVGIPPRLSLQHVVKVLEARTTTGTLMLNADNHAMLVAKTWDGDRSAYHFYDPNVCVVEFATPEAMLRELNSYFGSMGMAEFYSAYGERSLPTFDLIEVQGAQIAQLELAPGVRVEDVLSPGDLKGIDAPGGRKRLASARGQSLVNNPRLGKSLMELDSHWWGQQITEASNDLLGKNKLTSDFIPLFETLEINASGDYHLSLIKPEKPGSPEQLVRVTTDDSRFLRIKNHLTELFDQLTTRRVGSLDPTNVGAVHTLNAGFAIQALMKLLRSHDGEDRNLTLAVRLHAYVNYAQLIHGLVTDIAGVISLVRQGLAQERLIAETSSTVAGEALGRIAGEGLGTVLGMVNVGFDLYQLSQADNDVDVARFSTQLAFDYASLVLGAAGMGAGLASAATAAAFLGGASVIVGGLAVGVAALAEGFAMVAERSKQVGVFFYELDQAYRGAAFSWDKKQKAWQAHPKLVIQSLNLRDGVVTYGSQRLFPLRDHFGVPDFDVDYDRAINLRQSLGLPGSARFSPAAGEVIILPCTPQTFYGYDYHSLPFASTRHDTGFDIARRLETKNAQGQWQFLFTFYSFPGEYIVQAIHPAYRPGTRTVIQVTLDDESRTLVVPTLLKSWHDRIAYEIEAGDAPCTLMLSEGINVELKSSLLKTLQWVLVASWAQVEDVQFVRGAGLKIGGVDITFSGKAGFDITLHLAGNNRYRIDHHQQVLMPLEVDATPGTDARALQTHFKALAREHRLEQPYTPVHKFLIPFDDPQEQRYTTAYYDSAQDRFLYIQDDDARVPDDSQLGAVVDGSAYFYHPQGADVFKTDAVSGLISHRYRLMLKTGTSTITQCTALPGGEVKVVQAFIQDDQNYSVEYLLTDDGAFLSSLARGLDTTLEDVLGLASTLVDWKPLLGDYIAWPTVPSLERFETSTWQLAAFVAIHWNPEQGRSDMSWVRSSDGLIVRPIPPRHHARGWPDLEKDQNQLSLLTPAGTDGDVFVIYRHASARLCVQRRTMVDEQVALTVEWKSLEGLKNVVVAQEGCVALTEKGVYYEVTPQGELQLRGVTEAWFKDRPQWWLQLPAVVAQVPSATLALIGLSNARGDARLCAWYLEGRLLLADPGHGKEVRLLGPTPDSKAAWLFDVTTGEIYRQAFIDDKQLSKAFGEGTRLLAPDALPTPQPSWSPWVFTDVTRRGAGLLATTVEGIEMALNHQEPALITGVDSQWVRTHDSALTRHLRALVENWQHCAPLLRVAHPWRQQWFVSSSGRLIDAANVAHPDSSVVVGTRQQTNVMLFDGADGVLRSYPLTETVVPLAYMQRNVDTLTVESNSTLDDVLPLIPDDVTTLVLRLGHGGTTCRLSQAAWRRLESVIVDCRPPLGSQATVPVILALTLDSPEQLIVSLTDEHLVILDPDTCHSLIFRDANAKDVTLRGEVLLSISGYRDFAVSALARVLAVNPEPAAGEALKAFLPAVQVAEEELQA
ncbi:TcdA/TcdB pore-forming domain-containing protein [Pseudomonas frederiksbergensis]|uniref:TcdA/TcdB pore-forming domain-containing protein n=1 Tax=Pseudomonas frederiksbergensis TaxID=104087 RepID=UPI003D195133